MFQKLLLVFFCCVIAVLSAMGGFLASESLQVMKATIERQAELQMKKQPPIEIAWISLKPRDFWIQYKITGLIEPWRQSDLSFAEGGIVTSVKVDMGSSVTGPNEKGRGELLAILDTKKIEANLESIKAEVHKAKWDLDRVRNLAFQRIESQENVKNAQLLYDIKLALLKTVEKQLLDSYLHAPFSGEIVSKNIEIGEYCPPGRVAFRIVQTNTVKVVVQVPEYQIRNIHKQQKCIVSLDGLKESLEGEVFEISPASQTDRFFRVEIKVNNANKKLRAGMVAHVEILTRNLKNVYVLPFESMVRSGIYHKVMLVEEGKILDYHYDLGKMPPEHEANVLNYLKNRKDSSLEIAEEEWEKLKIPPTVLLKAHVKEPKRIKAKGKIVSIYHVGLYAKSRIIENFSIQGTDCIIEETNIFKPEERLIIRGQHRLNDKTEVVVASKDELIAE